MKKARRSRSDIRFPPVPRLSPVYRPTRGDRIHSIRPGIALHEGGNNDDQENIGGKPPHRSGRRRRGRRRRGRPAASRPRGNRPEGRCPAAAIRGPGPDRHRVPVWRGCRPADSEVRRLSRTRVHARRYRDQGRCRPGPVREADRRRRPGDHRLFRFGPDHGGGPGVRTEEHPADRQHSGRPEIDGTRLQMGFPQFPDRPDDRRGCLQEPEKAVRGDRSDTEDRCAAPRQRHLRHQPRRRSLLR